VPRPIDLAPAIDHFARAIDPCLTPAGFDHARAATAVAVLVRELQADGAPPPHIVAFAGELATPRPDPREPVWPLSLPNWVRTAAQIALRAGAR
jgi:hypothetical protein